MQIFDVESGPDLGRARELMPPFIEADVATGNLKDQDKIYAKIAERRANHESSWMESAALRPETARVLAIGILPHRIEEPILFHIRETTEEEILSSFWSYFEQTQLRNGDRFAGWGIFHFDLPFLILRSRILGLPVPPLLRQGRFFNPTRFLDVQDDWLLGRSRTEVKCSLDYVAQALSCGKKTAEASDFATLYTFSPTAALAYLKNDLLLTKKIAVKLAIPDVLVPANQLL